MGDHPNGKITISIILLWALYIFVILVALAAIGATVYVRVINNG